MKNTSKPFCPTPFRRLLWCLVSAVSLVLFSPHASAQLDDDAAMAMLKKNDCTKCHSVTKTKKGPAYKKIAAKYRDKPDAMEKLYEQVTTGPEVELEDGTKEDHKIIETKDRQEIDDLLRWILAR